ncbi:hypothetical protein ACQ4M4_25940 [Leptolyngbya sp. AN02str]|uniref:hypothetical protein n=1 Tax=Leptolyngbya sp. AN02str TaxID=3423363 RepID=UPI003D3217B8
MKHPYWLLVGSVAIALGSASAAQADDISLEFDLMAASSSASVEEAIAEEAVDLETVVRPLAIPSKAANAPVQPEAHRKLKDLPPPPPLPQGVVFAAVSTPEPPPQFVPEPLVDLGLAPTVEAAEQPADKPDRAARPIELSFALDELEITAAPMPPKPVVAAQGGMAIASLDTLFEGASDSLVARTVGSAEGTRTPEGLRTKAYYGHTDPGNGVWNLGSFSYQHGAATPEEADSKQLARLQRQAATLQQKANAYGLTLTLEETLNGIDLANQAPLAALDRGGYIDWLVQAKELGMTGDEAILWSRTRSFIDPDSQQWNAPGLGNNIHSISHDQERRMGMITKALQSYQETAIATAPPQSTAPVTAAIVPGLDTDGSASASPSAGDVAMAQSTPTNATQSNSGAIANLQQTVEDIGLERLFGLDL